MRFPQSLFSRINAKQAFTAPAGQLQTPPLAMDLVYSPYTTKVQQGERGNTLEASSLMQDGFLL